VGLAGLGEDIALMVGAGLSVGLFGLGGGSLLHPSIALLSGSQSPSRTAMNCRNVIIMQVSRVDGCRMLDNDVLARFTCPGTLGFQN
jgi:hypothetical protein